MNNRNISHTLKKIQEEQVRHTLDILEYIVCQKKIDDIEALLNVFSYKNTIIKYLISSEIRNKAFVFNNKKERFKALNDYAKGYYGCIQSIIKEYAKNGKLEESSFSTFSRLKQELDFFLLQLTIDIEGYEKKFDSLTNLLNRKYFLEEVKIHYPRVEHSLVMVDIDNFKLINDTYGHPAGDRVIQELADLFRKTLRVNDLIGRYGGEEYIFVLGGDIETIKQVVKRLKIKIEECEFKLDEGDTISITCSFGIAESTKGASTQNLIKQADKALYASKNNGRNRITVYNETQE